MDRNSIALASFRACTTVALRKESVDRNTLSLLFRLVAGVALRKESVDRNWPCGRLSMLISLVALRKESVDRNTNPGSTTLTFPGSLSARRAWIEMVKLFRQNYECFGRSPQGERG